MDAAWVGVIGVAVGALVGLGGSWMTTRLNLKAQKEARADHRRDEERARADRYVLALAPVLAGASLLIDELQVNDLMRAAGSDDDVELRRLEQLFHGASTTLADLRPQILELAFQAPTDELFDSLWRMNLELPNLHRQVSKACRNYVFNADPGRVEGTAKDTWIRASEAIDEANAAAAGLRRIGPFSSLAFAAE